MQGEVSPLVVAQEEGYWEDRGLAVQIRRGHGQAATAKAVGKGDVEIGVANPGGVMSVTQQGLDATVIGTQVPQDPSNIVGSSSLEGVVGEKGAHAPGSGSRLIFDLVMDQEGISWEDQTEMESTWSFTDLYMQDKTDFVIGWVTDAGVYWFNEEDPLRPEMIMLNDFLSIYGNSFIANEPWLEENEETATKFLNGVYDAWTTTLENTSDGLTNALDTLFRVYPEQAGGDTATLINTASAETYWGIMADDEVTQNHGMGYIDEQRARTSVDFFNNNLLDGTVSFEDTYYDGLDTRLIESGDHMIENMGEVQDFLSTVGPTLDMDVEIPNPAM